MTKSLCQVRQAGLSGPAEVFEATMGDRLSVFKALEKADGKDQIYTHSEIAFEAEQVRCRNGIPSQPAGVEAMHRIADQLGISATR